MASPFSAEWIDALNASTVVDPGSPSWASAGTVAVTLTDQPLPAGASCHMYAELGGAAGIRFTPSLPARDALASWRMTTTSFRGWAGSGIGQLIRDGRFARDVSIQDPEHAYHQYLWRSIDVLDSLGGTFPQWLAEAV